MHFQRSVTTRTHIAGQGLPPKCSQAEPLHYNPGLVQRPINNRYNSSTSTYCLTDAKSCAHTGTSDIADRPQKQSFAIFIWPGVQPRLELQYEAKWAVVTRGNVWEDVRVMNSVRDGLRHKKVIQAPTCESINRQM